jgi:hypothetical protein
MRRTKANFFIIAVVFGCITFAASRPALAYIGPGTGLSALGALLSFFAALLFAVIGFVWYPFKRIVRARKKIDSKSKENKQ